MESQKRGGLPDGDSLKLKHFFEFHVNLKEMGRAYASSPNDPFHVAFVRLSGGGGGARPFAEEKGPFAEGPAGLCQSGPCLFFFVIVQSAKLRFARLEAQWQGARWPVACGPDSERVRSDSHNPKPVRSLARDGPLAIYVRCGYPPL